MSYADGPARDRRELAELKRHAHADDRVERAHEDRRHAGDREAGRYRRQCQGSREDGEGDAGATVTRRRYRWDVPPRLRGRVGRAIVAGVALMAGTVTIGLRFLRYLACL